METCRIYIIIFGILCPLTSSAPNVKNATRNSNCRLLDIPLQKHFNMSKFEGKWFGALKTGTQDSLHVFFTEIYDVRIVFSLNSKGGFDFKAVGSKFYGNWCPKGNGYVSLAAQSNPEKMTIYFNTSMGRQIGVKPAWILRTDYKNYAVIFSCLDKLPTGRCKPAKTYAFVLQRNTSPLKKSRQRAVNRALKSACVNVKKLSPVKHYGYCVGEGL